MTRHTNRRTSSSTHHDSSQSLTSRQKTKQVFSRWGSLGPWRKDYDTAMSVDIRGSPSTLPAGHPILSLGNSGQLLRPLLVNTRRQSNRRRPNKKSLWNEKMETKKTSWKKKNVMKIQNIQEEEKYSKNNNNSMSSEKLDSYFNTPIKSELEAIKKNLFCRK